MLAAHEMFKNANRVSRAEKALILGFMAGARGKLKSTNFYLLTALFTVKHATGRAVCRRNDEAIDLCKRHR